MGMLSEILIIMTGMRPRCMILSKDLSAKKMANVAVCYERSISAKGGYNCIVDIIRWNQPIPSNTNI